MSEQRAVITTWLLGSHIRGNLSIAYVIAQNVDGSFVTSNHKYSTADGARRAARKRGLRIEHRGVYQGHSDARVALGLSPIVYIKGIAHVDGVAQQ